MKTKVIILSAFMAVLAIPAAMAQVSETGTASVTLGPTPLTLSVSMGTVLNFGNLNVPISQGTVVVSPVLPPTYNGVVPNAPINASFISFEVSGGASKTYAITVPSGSVALTGASTSTTVTLSAFTATAPTRTLNTSGTDIFGVGATLTLNPTDKEDTYTGTFPVSVAYN